jgi:delta 1-pyrroline-5-carboxylate dehydrogenase
LEGEVYAPILHIVKFEEREKDDVIHAINSSGYGFACSVFTENPYLNWT